MKTRAALVLDTIEYVQKERNSNNVPEDLEQRENYFKNLLAYTYTVFSTGDGKFIKEAGAYKLYLPENLSFGQPDYFIFDEIIQALLNTFYELVIDTYENKNGEPGNPIYKNNYSTLKERLKELKLL